MPFLSLSTNLTNTMTPPLWPLQSFPTLPHSVGHLGQHQCHSNSALTPEGQHAKSSHSQSRSQQGQGQAKLTRWVSIVVMTNPHNQQCQEPALYISTPMEVSAKFHSQPVWGPILPTSAPAAITANHNMSRTPGFGDWRDCNTGPHRASHKK